MRASNDPQYVILSHSHIFEPGELKISKSVKEEIVGLGRFIKNGADIARDHFPLNSETIKNCKSRPLEPQDVKRLLKQFLPAYETQNLPSASALVKLAENKNIVKFNFASILQNQESLFGESELQKIVDTPEDRFFLMYMSERQREMFRMYPYQLCADG